MHLTQLQARLLAAAIDRASLSKSASLVPDRSNVDPGRAVAAFALARAFEGLPVFEAAATRTATLVVVPSPAWIKPVAELLEHALVPPDRVVFAHEGLFFGRSEAGPLLTLLTPPDPTASKTSAVLEDKREKSFLNAMRQRIPVVAIATAASDVLPPALAYEYFDAIVTVAIDDQSIGDCMAYFAIGSYEPLGELARDLDPRLFRLAFAPDRVSAASARQVLLSSPTTPTGTPAIGIEDLHGMAPLVAWAIGVRDDLDAFRAGETQWRNAGALLIGPPGTGKTKASAAVAHYLGIKLIATSVATWMTYRGGDLGDFCSAVRNTFEEARKNAPVLVFIDECDALGQRGHGERDTWWNTAINAILEQLDGHADNSGIVVLGACNGGAETLDPALIRAGRLETHITIGYPNIREREAVLRFCLGKDLPAANLRAVAARLSGHPQATLAKIVADARRFARMASRPVSEADLELSLIGIAPPLKPAVVKRFCIHEAGHALVAMLEGLPVAAVAIGATGLRSTGAYTTVDTLHDETGDLASVRRFVRVLLAGRAAEALLLGVVSDGSGNDLLVATAELVRVHAASGLGPTLRWRDIPSDRFHALPAELAEPIERILQEEYANASNLLADRCETLKAVVKVLEDERHIDGNRLTELFGSEFLEQGARP